MNNNKKLNHKIVGHSFAKRYKMMGTSTSEFTVIAAQIAHRDTSVRSLDLSHFGLLLFCSEILYNVHNQQNGDRIFMDIILVLITLIHLFKNHFCEV